MFMSTSEIAFRWMLQDLTTNKSTLVQITAWCCQAPSHYLSQYWPKSLWLYDVTRPRSHSQTVAPGGAGFTAGLGLLESSLANILARSGGWGAMTIGEGGCAFSTEACFMRPPPDMLAGALIWGTSGGGEVAGEDFTWGAVSNVPRALLAGGKPENARYHRVSTQKRQDSTTQTAYFEYWSVNSKET